MKRIFTLIPTFLFLLAVSSLTSGFIYAQRPGTVTGKMVDASNSEALFFGNVSVKGTAIGTVTDEYGRFELERVPTGQQIIVLSYIGYNPKEVTVIIESGETEDIGTHTLSIQSVMGEEVTVTAQLRGQASAINQQVKSNNIVNVVSKEKIQETPDANAAETLSRLPGVTLQRSGGEGSQVSVRGVAPRFNSIMVNGQVLPGTGANDRSVNLSMVSSDLLDGIEVYKALTPDMDADAIGGSVNLVTKTADPGFQGRVQVESGYHTLMKDIGTYRGSITLGNRFFDDKLGLIAGANYHRVNRNTDFYSGSIVAAAGTETFRTNSADFNNRTETRDRYGVSATVDYKFKNGKLIFDHAYSGTKRDMITRGMYGRPSISVIEMDISMSENEIALNSTNLRGEFELFQMMELSLYLGRNSTTNETPNGYGALAGMEAGLKSEAEDVSPTEIFRYTQPYVGLDQFLGRPGVFKSYNFLEDVNYIGQVDLKIPFNLGTWIFGDVKFGGKVRQKFRERDVERYGVRDGAQMEFIFRERFPEYANRRVQSGAYPMALFIDKDYTGYDSPFADYNDIPFVYDPDIVREIENTLLAYDTLLARLTDDYFQEYEALERITAGYIMAQINIGERITFIPGFRYENTYMDFAGTAGTQRNNEPFRITKSDTSATSSSGEFLPMVHLKYEFIDGLALRLAATRTLSRPNFLNLTPFTQKTVANQKRVKLGSVNLEIPTAWNYDAMLSWFSKFGLVSVGAFYKEIYNIDINVRQIDYSGSKEPEAPDYNEFHGWVVNSPISSEETTTIYGGEMEIQTNFRFLPKPLDGIVLSGNLTIMESETFYPFYYLTYPPPDYTPVTADSSRANRTVGQADFIANMTLGYEKGGFSGRISMNYQGVRLRTSDNSPFQDEFDDEYIRWDAALSYKINDHWQVLANLVNLTDETERRYIYQPENISRIENYGRRFTLGVRYNFNYR